MTPRSEGVNPLAVLYGAGLFREADPYKGPGIRFQFGQPAPTIGPPPAATSPGEQYPDPPGTPSEPSSYDGGNANYSGGGPEPGGTHQVVGVDNTGGMSIGLPSGWSASGTAPNEFNSSIGSWAGTLGSLAGMGLGVPGLGMAGSIGGNLIDSSRYASNLEAAGIPHTPNYFDSVLTGATSLPFGLGSVAGWFGAQSPREQFEGSRRDALANGRLGNNVAAGLDPGPLGQLANPQAPQSFWGSMFGQPTGADFDALFGGAPAAAPTPTADFFPGLGTAYSMSGFNADTLGDGYGVQGAPPGQTGYANDTTYGLGGQPETASPWAGGGNNGSGGNEGGSGGYGGSGGATDGGASGVDYGGGVSDSWR